MKKILILIIICTSSCMIPYSSYDYVEPTKYIYYPTYQPTRVIVKQKHNHKHRSNKRHVKVRINKHRKNK